MGFILGPVKLLRMAMTLENFNGELGVQILTQPTLE
jgi:hypothetical protein